MKLSIDFETRSTAELKEVGLDNYARHPDTSPWCMAWAFDDDEPALWVLGDPIPLDVALHIKDGGLIYAHNAAFEWAIWNHVCVPRYRWPALSIKQTRCTMAACYATALPGSLEKAAAALGIAQQKDLAGGRLMMQMSRPREVKPDGTIIWWDEPAKLAALYEYCKQDVRVEQELDKRLLPLSDAEQRLWEIDHAINNRGVYVDQPAILSAIEVVRTESDRLNRDIRTTTGNTVGFTSEVARLTQWIRGRGVVLDGLAKSAVLDTLAVDTLPDDVRSALLIRQEAGKTSTAKLQTMLTAASADGRVKNTMQFHGAGTGRWAGRRIQPHNMPRPTLSRQEVEAVLDFLPRLPVEQAVRRIELLYGQPLSVISDCLRGMICAAPGHELIAGDYSNIEGRGIAWLAGEEWKLDAFRKQDAKTGPEIYILTAEKIYPHKKGQITKKSPERQIGKVAELACLGADTLVLTNHGIKGILEVTTDDQVWDGNTWVSHQGLRANGVRQVVRVAGIELTPDHLICIQGIWHPARQLVSSESILSLALETGSANLPWSDTESEPQAGCGRFKFSAHVGRNLITCISTICSKVAARDVMCARKGNPVIGAKTFGPTRTSCQTTHTGGDYLTESQRVLIGVTTPTTEDFKTTGLGGLPCGRIGKRIAVIFWLTWLRWMDGKTRLWNWIESTLIGGTNRGTCGLSAGRSTPEIAEKFKPCKNELTNSKPVYDLVDAGPRNRFTILTSRGFLLVHNCGYQGGTGAFQTMAKTYLVKVPDAEAEVIKTQWREAHPKIVQYWYDLEVAAIEAVMHPGLKTSAGPKGRASTFLVKGSFLFCKLPSGRVLTYPYPKLKPRETPWGDVKEQLHYMTVDGLSGKWVETHTYGGKLSENITQAICRDLLSHSIQVCEAHSYPVVLHVHDEIVVELGAKWARIAEPRVYEAMACTPPWADGLPVVVEGWRGARYRK